MTNKINTLASLAIAGFAAAYSLMPAGAGANDDADMRVLKDGKGASFNVGTKKAVAYFVKEAGSCKVSVMVSETYPEQMSYNIATVKFSANVAAGTSAAMSTSDGAALELTCAQGAKSLSVETIDQVAAIAPRTTN